MFLHDKIKGISLGASSNFELVHANHIDNT